MGMGILRLFKRTAETATTQLEYVLELQQFARNPETGKLGWLKVSEVEQELTPEDVKETVAPGRWRLVKRYKKTGTVDVIWSARFMGETGEETLGQPEEKPRRKTDALEALITFAEEMEQMTEKFEKASKILARMSGYISDEDLVRRLQEIRNKAQTYADVFGLTRVSESHNIPVTGSIPATIVYAPQLMNQTLDIIEKRMRKWKIIPEEQDKEELIKI